MFPATLLFYKSWLRLWRAYSGVGLQELGSLVVFNKTPRITLFLDASWPGSGGFHTHTYRFFVEKFMFTHNLVENLSTCAHHLSSCFFWSTLQAHFQGWTVPETLLSSAWILIFNWHLEISTMQTKHYPGLVAYIYPYLPIIYPKITYLNTD